MKSSLMLFVYLLAMAAGLSAQDGTNAPDPKVAFLKSMVLPGWGHHYVDQSSWTRGQFHVAAEAALLLSYLGLSIHSNNLQQNWYTYGNAGAGVPIEGRGRQFQLAVGDFNSLEAYNDFQLRSRNWDQLIDDQPQNKWQWSGDEARLEYSRLRTNFERIDQQLPALLVLMGINRIISGISAYNKARKKTDQQSIAGNFYLSPHRMPGSIVANLKVSF